MSKSLFAVLHGRRCNYLSKNSLGNLILMRLYFLESEKHYQTSQRLELSVKRPKLSWLVIWASTQVPGRYYVGLSLWEDISYETSWSR